MSAAATLMAGAVTWMKDHAGPIEQPPGSNRVEPVWPVVAPSFQGQPWCAGAVVAAYLSVGVDLRPVFAPTPFYVPTIEAVARKRGWWKTTSANRGDLTIYGTPTQAAVHIGISDPGPDPLYWAYEGNTSPTDAGSQANGGGLYRRGRKRSWIRGWVDMARVIADTQPITPPTSTPSEDDDMRIITDGTRTALVGPGYLATLDTPEAVDVTKALVGSPVVTGNARQYDVWVAACTQGRDVTAPTVTAEALQAAIRGALAGLIGGAK